MHILSQKTWSDTQHEKLLSSCGEKGENKSKTSQHNKEKGQAFEILRFHWRVFERGQSNLVPILLPTQLPKLREISSESFVTRGARKASKILKP